EELFPFAHDFYDCWTESIHAGKLPDGTQLIVQETARAIVDGRAVATTGPAAVELVVDGLAFGPDGTLRPEPFRLPLPQELWWRGDLHSHEEQQHIHRGRKEFLRRVVGFEPALVRVRGFSTDWLGRPERFWEGVEDCWGIPDPPGLNPASDFNIRQGGN